MPHKDPEARRKYQREYRIIYSAKEEVKERVRRRARLRRKNPEVREKEKEYAQSLRGRALQRERTLRYRRKKIRTEEEKERIRQYLKAYKARRRNDPAFKELNRIHSQKRRAKMIGGFTRNDLNEIRRLQRNRCAVCRGILSEFHIDHIKPLSLGGENNRKNIQLLCVDCNLTKHAKDPIKFMRSLGRLL